jgi:hypothetical protein
LENEYTLVKEEMGLARTKQGLESEIKEMEAGDKGK